MTISRLLRGSTVQDHPLIAAAGRAPPPDHIHLPQLHRPGPLPPAIVRPTAPPLLRRHQTMPHQRPINTRPARHRANPVLFELVTDPARTPHRMHPPDLHNPRLSRRTHLMRTRMRPRRPITQTAQASLGGIPAQPNVHTLPRHPEPAGHLSHRGALQHLPHRPIPLLGHPQLHQHHRLLPQSEDHERTHPTDTATTAGTAKVSSTYRNDCRAGTGTAS